MKKENKKEYITPEIEVVILDCEDIITASTFDPSGILDSTDFESWF